MSYVHTLKIGTNEYLIEPILYTTTLGTGNAYSASIDNFEALAGTLLFITVNVDSAAAATLTINNGDAIPIYYQGSAVTANLLKQGQTYALTYASNRWNILNNLSGGASLSIDSNGGLEEGINGLKIKNNGIVNSMIVDGTIENSKLEYASITIAGNEVVLGGSISLADLGLSTALHFKGFAQNNSLAEGSTANPFSTSNTPPTYNGDPGDVVIDINKEYEYVWIDSTDGWERLGGNNSYKIIQTAVSDPVTNGESNEFIDTISQNANGEITVTKKYVSSWHYGRKVYTDLTNASQNISVNGSTENASAVGIGIDGILGVNNGGTGSDENDWQAGGILYGTQNLSTKKYVSIAGLAHQILTSGGAGAPVWATAGLLESIVNNTPNAQNYTTLELGNEIDIANASAGHSEGRIVLYSAGTEAHLIKGNKTTTGYTHTLQNANGFILQSQNAGQVGSTTQPIYINSSGLATAITYTPNRLYYSAASNSFAETNHYANSGHIGINVTTWPQLNGTDITDNLYVNGATTITGVLNITDQTDVTNNTNGALIIAGGATINKKLHVISNATFDGTITINDDAIFNDTIEVVGNSTLTGRVGIGTDPDSSTSGDQHILHIQGSTLISGSNDALAHMDITLGSNSQEVFIFIPEDTGTGSIGTSTAQWQSASFSDLITIGNNTSGITLDATSYIELVNDTSSILLTTIDEELNEAGILTITAEIPTIILAPITNSSSYKTWTITNEETELIITNDDETSIIGNNDGWEINSHVGIGIEPDDSNSDNHILVINGSTLLVNDSTGVAHLDIDTSYSSLDFFPVTNKLGSIGLNASRWNSIYASNLVSVKDGDCLITLEVDGTQGNLTSVLTMEANSPTINLNTLANNSVDWTISNEQNVFYITNNANTELIGNNYGMRLNGRLYINNGNVLTQSNTLDLYVGGDAEILGHIGIGAPPLASNTNYALYVYGDTQIRGNIVPQADNSYNLGIDDTSRLRWANLFLSDTLSISHYNTTNNNLDSSITLDKTGVAVIRASASQLALETTATGASASTWTFLNTSGTFTLSNDIGMTLKGNNYGYAISTNLYVNDNIPSTNPYTFYVNGTSGYKGAISYINSSGNVTLTIDPSTPAIYPNTTNSGTLGVGGLNPNRWGAVFIGTADGYGDSYSPVYWNNGIPEVTYPVQYFTWQIDEGDVGVTLTGTNIFTTNTFNITIVVTSGEANLNGPLTWDSDTNNTFIIRSTQATSGNVAGYAVVARGIDITTSLTPTGISPST